MAIRKLNCVSNKKQEQIILLWRLFYDLFPNCRPWCECNDLFVFGEVSCLMAAFSVAFASPPSRVRNAITTRTSAENLGHSMHA